jgi:hypothetical protein
VRPDGHPSAPKPVPVRVRSGVVVCPRDGGSAPSRRLPACRPAAAVSAASGRGAPIRPRGRGAVSGRSRSSLSPLSIGRMAAALWLASGILLCLAAVQVTPLQPRPPAVAPFPAVTVCGSDARGGRSWR